MLTLNRFLLHVRLSLILNETRFKKARFLARLRAECMVTDFPRPMPQTPCPLPAATTAENRRYLPTVAVIVDTAYK